MVNWARVKYFKPEEFACKDGCGLNNPDPGLVYDLDSARSIIGEPLVIASACRCAAHNAAVGGAPDSAHLPSRIDGMCKAADIYCTSDALRFRLVQFFLGLGYVRLEVSNLHVHVDRAQDEKPWPYFGETHLKEGTA